MLYSVEEIEEALLCSKCNRKYDIPKILPCGSIICSSCEKEMFDLDSTQFKCICDNMHDKPINAALPSNEKLSKLTKLKSFYNPFSKFAEERLNNLRLDILNSENKIHEHCDSLRYNIDVSCESAIANIQKIRDKLIEQVDDYEKSCKSKEKKYFQTYDQLISFTDEVKKNYEELNRICLDNQLSEDKFKEIQTKLQELDKKVVNKSKSLNFSLFCGKKMTYNATNCKPDPDFLGTIVFDSTENLLDRFKCFSAINLNSIKLTVYEMKAVFAPIAQYCKVVSLVKYCLYFQVRIHDRFGQIIQTIDVREAENHNNFQLIALDNSIFIAFNIETTSPKSREKIISGKIMCLTYDLIFDKDKEKSIDKFVNVFGFKKSLYVNHKEKIAVYNDELKFMKIMEQSSFSLYYTSYLLKDKDFIVMNIKDVIAAHNEKSIHVLNSNGQQISKFDLNLKNFLCIAQNSNVVILSKDENKIILFNFKGTILGTTDVTCTKNITSWDINEYGDILLADLDSRCIYLNDSLI